jgi:predicted membrane channel-forming protein YqfA (hemolysin III family)
MFVAMGLSAVFPVLHGIKLYGVNETRRRIGLSWMLLQGLLYIAGAGLYAVSCCYAKRDQSLTGIGTLARESRSRVI